MRSYYLFLASLLLTACSGGQDATEAAPQFGPAENQSILDPSTQPANALQMYMLDCGLIQISDLDGFSSAGDYAGLQDTFADTCWLIRHPEGNFLWDLGLPTGLVGNGEQTSDVFTLSLDRTLSDQLVEIGLFASDVDMVSISHSHFDHSGQADQFQNSKWIVHADEYAAMFPEEHEGGEAEDPQDETDESTSNPYLDFASLDRKEFTGEYDVFGDGRVIIVPTPGHTPGHTSLLVTLPEAGPVFLTGDLYHRVESRELKRVPRFNYDERATLASMDVFEARVKTTGARVIIQHDRDDIAELPKSPEPMK